MLSWGLIVFVGLWLLLADLTPVRRAQLMGNPWLIHVIVIGSGLCIHGGSADGAMAAIVSGVFSALYVRYQQRCTAAFARTSGIPACSASAIRDWESVMTTVASCPTRPLRHRHRPHRRRARTWCRPLGPAVVAGRRRHADERRQPAPVPRHQRAAAGAGSHQPRLSPQPLAHLPPGRRAGRPGAPRRTRHHRRPLAAAQGRGDRRVLSGSRRIRTCPSGSSRCCAAFTVFNLAQVDGVPAALAAVGAADWEPEARAEELLADVGRHPPPRRLAGVLSPGRRRDPPAAARARSRTPRATTPRRCTSSPTGPSHPSRLQPAARAALRR